MNADQPKELSPLAIAMIERCTEIVLAHKGAHTVGELQLVGFSSHFRKQLRAGQCVVVRRQRFQVLACTAGNIQIQPGAIMDGLRLNITAASADLPWKEVPS